MRNGVAGIVVASLLGACGPSAHDTCVDRLTRFDAALAAVPDEIPAEPPRGLDVPRSSRGEARSSIAPSLRVSASGELTMDGRTEPLDAVVADVGTMHRNWSILHPRDPYPAEIVVWAEGSVPLARLAPIVSAVPDHHFVLGVLDANAPRPPHLVCPQSIASECTDIASTDLTTQSTAIARAMQGTIGTCAPVIRLFGTLANVDATERATRLRAGLSPAVRACDCSGVDMDALEFLVMEVLGAQSVRTRVVPLPSSIDATSELTVEAWLAQRG